MASVTIQMGNSPKPTATITSGSVNFNGSQVTVTFAYELNAMSGYSYWGYGVNLQYGGTSELGETLNLVGTGSRQWSKQTGTVSITKNANTSPQTFYFRLNSVATTSGAPGSTGSLGVSFATKSEITNVGDFNIEGEHWLQFKTYGNYWHNLWVQGRKKDTGNYETVGVFGGYTSGKHVKFEPWGITYLYKASTPDTKPREYTDILYHLEIWTSQGGTYIGEDTRTVKGYINGTMFTKLNNTWKLTPTV